MKRALNLKQLRLGVLASVVMALCATPLAQAGRLRMSSASILPLPFTSETALT